MTKTGGGPITAEIIRQAMDSIKKQGIGHPQNIYDNRYGWVVLDGKLTQKGKKWMEEINKAMK